MSILKTNIEKLYDLKKSDEIFRLGKLFNTNKNKYYYDVGTGKVLLLDEGSYSLLFFLFDKSDYRTLNDFEKSLTKNDLNEIEEFKKIIEKEKLFLAPKLEKLQTLSHGKNLELKVNNKLGQVILELTGKCNLRDRKSVV